MADVSVTGAAPEFAPSVRAARAEPRLDLALCRLLDAARPGTPPAAVHRAIVRAVVDDLGFPAAALHVVGAAESLSVVTRAGRAHEGFGEARTPAAWDVAIAAGDLVAARLLWLVTDAAGDDVVAVLPVRDDATRARLLLEVALPSVAPPSVAPAADAPAPDAPAPDAPGGVRPELASDRTAHLLAVSRQSSLVLSAASPTRTEPPQRALHDRIRQQAAVAALGQSALAQPDPAVVLEEAARTVADGLRVPYVVLSAWDRGRPRTAAAHGLARGRGLSSGATTALWYAITTSGSPLVLNDVGVLPHPIRTCLADLGLEVTCAAGVLVGEAKHPWGTLVAFGNQADCFDPNDLVFLQGVANVVAAAQARAEAENEMRHRALHDALTGLPNRDFLHDRLAAVLARAGPERPESTWSDRTGHDGDDGPQAALLLIDLDRFKDVNDSQGHQAGDHVLRQVAHRLRSRLPTGATVARLGGDEFAVVLEGPQGPAQVAATAAALVGVLRAPFDTPGGGVGLGGSIGVALAPRDGRQPYTLLQRADVAMYRAKRERNGFAVYDPAVDEDAAVRLARIAELRTAISERKILIAYQPLVDLRTHAVTAVEALARWDHPTRGRQEPESFVALAEQSGLVADLTDVVLSEALAQGARWLRSGRGTPVAVNLSPAVLGTPGYADHLRRAVDDAGLPPGLVRIEVTETTLANDTAVEVLRAVRAMGMRVVVDDFGMGWSSLGRLKQLPVQTLKIDKAFVTGLDQDARDAAIVRSIVALAGELGLCVVAVGVETAATARLLPGLGVSRAQGNLFAPPCSVEEFEDWYRRWSAGERACCAHPA